VRLGLVALVVFLAASIIETRRKADGWQNSISAYFYTSSHGVFIASLCAVGICLIIYQGSTTTEDSLLNFSGFLAFVVGLVPTARAILRGPGLPDDFDPTAFVGNNVGALLIATVVGLAVFVIIRTIRTERPPATDDPPEEDGHTSAWQVPSQPVLAVVVRFVKTVMRAVAPVLRVVEIVLPYVLPAALIAGAVVFVVDQRLFIANAHGLAAAALFGGIIVVVVHYAYYAAASPDHKRWARYFFVVFYLFIASAMLLTVAAVIWLNMLRQGHGVLIVEAIVIGEFAAFWLAQSIDLWEYDKYPVSQPLSDLLKTLGQETPP
jgi:hypothetical protein